MKIKLRIDYLIAIFFFVAFGQARQAGEMFTGTFQEPGSKTRFVDNNRDGYNDLAPDTDRDGIPDLLDEGANNSFIDPGKFDFHSAGSVSCTISKDESTRQCCSSN